MVSAGKEIIIPLAIFASVDGIIALRIEFFPHAGGVDVFVALVPAAIDDFGLPWVVVEAFEVRVGDCADCGGFGAALFCRLQVRA